MPFEQTITIINNSGKIISTGKHLVGLFKEARSAYKEKKEALRQEREFPFRRANTFAAPGSGDYRGYHGPIVEEYEDGTALYDDYEVDYRRSHRAVGPGPVPLYLESGRSGRSGHSDRQSHVSSSSCRRHRSRRTVVGGDGDSVPGESRESRESRSSRQRLTASNLIALSEVSASQPSAAPSARRRLHDPKSRPGHREIAVSQDEAGSVCQPKSNAQLDSSPGAALPSVRTSMMIHRSHSDPMLRPRTGGKDGATTSSSERLDMSLAYGDIPPDLESRFDLDHIISGDEGPDRPQESQAQTLVDRIEALLNEAQCLHHTAASIICRLQDNPEAAAAVALTLAELSSILARLSPAFLGVVKGGSPAVFALLASPQFLIGTSIAVGVTVILFGGWKIIKRISETRSTQKDEKLAFEATGHARPQQQPDLRPGLDPTLAAPRDSASSPAVYDEALVLEEELSSIESWRRGIEYDEDAGTEPWAGSEAEIELISPEAMRSRVGDDDQRTLRSTRTSKSHGSKSVKSTRNHRRSKHHGDSTHREDETTPRQSSKEVQSEEVDKPQGRHRRHGDDAASDAGSAHSRHSSRHSSGRSHRGNSLASHGHSAGVSTARSQAAASDAGTTSSRERKNPNSGSGNMLKQLFKKKRTKDDKERQDFTSVLV